MTTLYGHGYIGTAIAKRLFERGDFYWYRHGERGILSRVVINAAGYTGSPNVDACEDHKTETIEGNILWPMELQSFYKLPIIHISSGCVYNGYKDGGWTEEDEPNFTGSFYSLTKVIAQKKINLDNSYLLRIRMPFGKEEHPKNLLTKLRRYEKLIDAENSLSCIDDIVDVVMFFVDNLPPPGIYNVCNGSTTTRKIADMMGLNKQWFTEEEFKNAVRVPRSNCVLSTDKLNSIFPIRSAEEALKGCV